MIATQGDAVLMLRRMVPFRDWTLSLNEPRNEELYTKNGTTVTSLFIDDVRWIAPYPCTLDCVNVVMVCVSITTVLSLTRPRCPTEALDGHTRTVGNGTLTFLDRHKALFQLDHASLFRYILEFKKEKKRDGLPSV
jgi:hypothetical protein